MQELLFKNEYPIFTMTLKKSETSFSTVKEIIDELQTKVMAHPVATFVGLFDHYQHTTCLADGQVSTEITDAQNILFCFGKELLVPEMLAVRPRSIGVAERNDDFVLSFLKAPNPVANDAMVMWTESLRNL